MTFIIMSLCCLLPLMTHPVMLGMLVLSISSMSSIMISNLMFSWYGYSLFLVYVGGILVMFSYVVAISPNFSGINYSYFMGLFFSFVFTNFLFNMFLDNDLYWSFNSINSGIMNTLCMSGLFNDYNIGVMVLLLIMLLGTMIMVVKICFYRSGPLRPFN